MCGTIISGHAVPVFHGMGLTLLWFMVRLCQCLCLECERTFCVNQVGTGITVAVFKPTVPPILPNPDLVYAGTVATKR